MSFNKIVLIGVIGSVMLSLLWFVFVVFGVFINMFIQAILSLFKRVFSNKR